MINLDVLTDLLEENGLSRLAWLAKQGPTALEELDRSIEIEIHHEEIDVSTISEPARRIAGMATAEVVAPTFRFVVDGEPIGFDVL